jgi:hypothetical protein
VKAAFKLRIVNHTSHTDLHGTINEEGVEFTPDLEFEMEEYFSSQFDELGAYDMIPQDWILFSEESGYYPYKKNDCVIIEVDIKVFGELVSTTSVQDDRFDQQLDTLVTDLSALLASSDDSDITIKVISEDASSGSGKEPHCQSFKAHSLMLKARSSYFRGMLNAPMREAANGHIVEYDMHPIVFSEVMNWIYTDRLSEGAVAAMGEYLFLAAKKYGLADALVQYCEVELCQSLTPENAATRLVLSDQAECARLKEASLSFIKGTASEVIQSSGWADLMAHNGGALAVDVISAMA